MAPEVPAADGSSPKTQRFDAAPPMIIDPTKTYTAEMLTNKGSLTIALDPIGAPQTVNNFVFLARWHYYDGIVFHRIIPGFMCQGGDPEGSGRGGPGYRFEDELPMPGPLRDRLDRHGQRRPEHQRQPVLHRERSRRRRPAPELLALRQGRQAASTWSRPSSRWAAASGAPSEPVIIESVTITEAD